MLVVIFETHVADICKQTAELVSQTIGNVFTQCADNTVVFLYFIALRMVDSFGLLELKL